MPGLLLTWKARSCLLGGLLGESGRSWEKPFGFDSTPKLASKCLQLLCQCRWNNKYERESRANSITLLTRLGLCTHHFLMCVGTTGPRSQFVSLTFWSEGFQWSRAEQLSHLIFRNCEANPLRLFQSRLGWWKKDYLRGNHHLPGSPTSLSWLRISNSPGWPLP